jgi:hypothetical protein
MRFVPKESLLNKEDRTKYDIWDFQFTCFHECREWEWGVCHHCRSRHTCQDHIRPVYPSEEGIYYPIEKIEVSLHHVQDLGTYIHEFTEVSIIQVLRRFRKDWHRDVEYKGYKRTYITHFISPLGEANGTCLEPVTKRNRPKW